MSSSLKGVKPGERRAELMSSANREYEVTYLVETTDKNDGGPTVLNTFGLPRIGETYNVGNDSDTEAVVVSVTPTETDSPFVWEVDVRWTTDQTVIVNNTGTIRAPELPDNPLRMAPRRRLRFRSRRIKARGKYSSPLTPPPDSIFDDPIKLPNNEFFEVDVDIEEPVMTITRNLPVLDVGRLMGFANVVNATPFSGAEARQLRLGGFDSEELWHHIIGPYVKFTYEVAFRFETWDIQVPLVGAYYLDGSGDRVWEPDRANPVQVQLTSTGGKNTGDMLFEGIRFYREAEFSSLGLF